MKTTPESLHVLITGGAGFVGSHLAEAELKSGNKVTAIDIRISDKISHFKSEPRFQFIQADSRDENALQSLIESADLIYHLGAIASPYVYIINPLEVLNTNIDSLRAVAKLCHAHKKKLVFSSSSEIYGNNPNVPWKETTFSAMSSPDKPRWCYAASKIIGEHYLFAYKRNGLKMTIGRFFNFYGPKLDNFSEKRSRVITAFLKDFFLNKPVTVVHPGDQVRCFTYISDAIDALREIAYNPAAEGEAFNIGNPEEITMLELAQLIKRLGNFSSPITIIDAQCFYGEGYDDILKRIPDVNKINTAVGWSAKVSLEEGLKKTIEYYTKQFQTGQLHI